MKTLCNRWLWIGAVLLAMLGGAAAAHAAVGRTRGTVSVSQTGEAQYAIPIYTPSGTKGLTPQLALVYAHRQGESIAGVGWNASGLSVISRCRKTWAQDGAPDAIYLTTADRFCLDGNQMKLVSGLPFRTSPGAFLRNFQELAGDQGYGVVLASMMRSDSASQARSSFFTLR